MLTGMWRRRQPLPPTPGTVLVCPIGEATPVEAERYRAAREASQLAHSERKDQPMRDLHPKAEAALLAPKVPIPVIPTIPDPLNPDPAAANCGCGAPDVAHCDGCMSCPGQGWHDEMCGW